MSPRQPRPAPTTRKDGNPEPPAPVTTLPTSLVPRPAAVVLSDLGGLDADDPALLVPIEVLTPHPDNARRGRIDLIAESIGEHGQYVPLTVQRSTGHVLKGNHTLAALERRGRTEAAVVYVDVDDAQALKILVGDNRISDLAQYEPRAQAAAVAKLRGEYVGTGITVHDVDGIAAAAREALPKEPPRLPTGPQPPLRSDRVREITCPSCAHVFDATAATEVRRPQNAGGRS